MPRATRARDTSDRTAGHQVNGLFLRAALAFLVMPGMVAFVVPLFVLRPETVPGGFSVIGALILTAGTAILGATVREFYVAGRGTLAPWEPPKSLVTSGLYRYSRNPMYVGVVTILAGWAVGFRSTTLGGYALAMLIVFHLRIVFGEEPWLAKAHGEAWASYVRTVRRWVGRFPVTGPT